MQLLEFQREWLRHSREHGELAFVYVFDRTGGVEGCPPFHVCRCLTWALVKNP